MGGTLLQPLGGEMGSCVEEPRIGDIRSSLPGSKEGGTHPSLSGLCNTVYTSYCLEDTRVGHIKLSLPGSREGRTHSIINTRISVY